MWIYQNALDEMYAVIKKNVIAGSLPAPCSCSKIQLQELWDEAHWKLDGYYAQLDWGDLDDGVEESIYRRIEIIESEIEEIDYQWSRFPPPCDPNYELEIDFNDFDDFQEFK